MSLSEAFEAGEDVSWITEETEEALRKSKTMRQELVKIERMIHGIESEAQA